MVLLRHVATMPRLSVRLLSWRLGISDADLYSRLHNLHPLLNVSGDTVEAYHRCFLEFIRDKKRAKKYYGGPVQTTLGLKTHAASYSILCVFSVATYRMIHTIALYRVGQKYQGRYLSSLRNSTPPSHFLAIYQMRQTSTSSSKDYRKNAPYAQPGINRHKRKRTRIPYRSSVLAINVSRP